MIEGPARRSGARLRSMVDALVVEDDASTAALIEITLRGRGVVVRTVATLADAQAALAERMPEVVVLDLGLPDGHGHSLMHELRTHGGRPVGIVVTSGVEDMGDDLGWADAFLRKPLDLDQVADVVRALAEVVRDPGAEPSRTGSD